MRRISTLAAAGGVLASLLAGCSSDDAADRLADARPRQVAGTELWAQLPTGRVTVTVGDPVTTIPGDEVAGGDAIEAGDGHAFRPVQVAYDDLAGVPWNAPQDPAVEPGDLTRLTLDVGEDSARVPFGDGSGRSYVEVARDAGSDLALEVEFDGVAQRVDAAGRREAGDAQGLYDDLTTPGRLSSCGEQAADRPEGAPAAVGRTCEYDLWSYPWLEGLGWASKRTSGATWVVATARTWVRADELRAGGEHCEAAGLQGATTLSVDGREPDEELTAKSFPVSGGRQLLEQDAFALPAASRHRLRITSTFRCRFSGETVDLPLVTTVTVP
ncbi:MAG TPA: hypothetical protein VNS81_07325 [Nocardioides sp.]|nr:hypothetical protein [Nocardioides sp.]